MSSASAEVAPWDFAVGQTHVQIEKVSYGGDVLAVIAAIPCTVPNAEEIAEEIVKQHNEAIT